MRFFYLILKITLQYSLRIFYKRIVLINSPKEFLGRTIYVSNHAASFMDPLVVAGLRRPLVFFMTRSDVFTPITKPILWAAHMLPIYREHDGVDTKSKNEEVFKKCANVLKYGRNLLIFGEGFTDDIFVRRLKPLKKGAARIGFLTLERQNWEIKIYIAGVGANYTQPNLMRSDILISTSDKFCLNDYKEMYLENPNKAINEVTKRIEECIQEQLTHVENIENCNFHEQIMMVNRKGMHPISYDKNLSLIQRWNYSRALAKWMNKQSFDEELVQLKADLNSYQKLMDKMKLSDDLIYAKQHLQENSNFSDYLKLIVLFPFMLLGLIHVFIPYFWIKRFVEKTFKRKVFWGSVKLLMGKIILGLLNIPFIFLFAKFIYPSYWLGFGYYACVGLFGISMYAWFKSYKAIQINKKLEKQDLSKIISKRTELLERIKRLIPEFNN
jgi:hypothetical protein